MLSVNDPHGSIEVLHTGAPIESANRALILIHGRGSTAREILTLAPEFAVADFAVLAPQATGNVWYPQRFMRPVEENEPYLSSALAAVDRLVQHLGDNGIPPERIAIGGFSQGACLTTEYAARHPRRYGAILAFSGGLIGDANKPLPIHHPGTPLAGTPVFIGCSDVDSHIPIERVDETASILSTMGGEVDKRIYPGMGHTINQDEIEAAAALLNAVGR
ncbi:MAG: dienelactone hydrolase family protein [Chloroflexi bacterium]|nr:dienelactone hydrolase family protein [Chloroflexota bacterium]